MASIAMLNYQKVTLVGGFRHFLYLSCEARGISTVGMGFSTSNTFLFDVSSRASMYFPIHVRIFWEVLKSQPQSHSGCFWCFSRFWYGRLFRYIVFLLLHRLDVVITDFLAVYRPCQYGTPCLSQWLDQVPPETGCGICEVKPQDRKPMVCP